MTNSKTYSYQLEQIDTLWTAKIIRKASRKTFIISKEQDGFASEIEAKEWAEQQLVEFSSALNSSNKRQAEQRKTSEEERRQRSIRRAEKKRLAKQAKAEDENIKKDMEEE